MTPLTLLKPLVMAMMELACTSMVLLVIFVAITFISFRYWITWGRIL